MASLSNFPLEADYYLQLLDTVKSWAQLHGRTSHTANTMAITHHWNPPVWADSDELVATVPRYFPDLKQSRHYYMMLREHMGQGSGGPSLVLEVRGHVRRLMPAWGFARQRGC